MFANRVRYFAMMEGSFRPAARWWDWLADFLGPKNEPVTEAPRHTTRENLLVALTTIYEKTPDGLQATCIHSPKRSRANG
jgi:hypothetical protein